MGSGASRTGETGDDAHPFPPTIFNAREHAGAPAPPRALRLLAVSCLVWAGMVLGVSFVATPAKFLAPSLTLPVALDVGRHTFGVFRPLELAGFLLTLGLAWTGRAGLEPGLRAGLVAFWGVLVLEWLWLIPTLDARALRVVAGEQLPPTYHHVVYIGLDLVKLVLLLGLGWVLGSAASSTDCRSRCRSAPTAHSQRPSGQRPRSPASS